MMVDEEWGAVIVDARDGWRCTFMEDAAARGKLSRAPPEAYRTCFRGRRLQLDQAAPPRCTALRRNLP